MNEITREFIAMTCTICAMYGAMVIMAVLGG